MTVDDDHIRAMRWLYDDEKSYRKAVTKLKLEEAKAQQEKELVKEYRRRQRSIYARKARIVSKQAQEAITPHVTRRRIIAAGALVSVISLVWVGSGVFNHFQKKPTKTPATGVLAGVVNKASFDPLIPTGKAQQFTPDKVTYDDKKNVLAYEDSYGTVNLTVSQQPLPESFKTDSTQIVKLAASLKAKEIVETPKGKAYIATDEATTQQTTIIATEGRLVFLRSSKKLEPIDWAEYISSLNLQKR